MTEKKNKNYCSTTLFIASLVFAGVILLFGEKSADDYKLNYFEKQENFALVDAKVTELGTTYQGYTAREGTKLYKIDYTVRNEGVTNQDYIYIYFDCTEPLQQNMDSIAYNFRDSSLAVVPAAMEGNRYTILEVPDGTTSVEASGYVESGEISLTIPLN